MAGKQAKILSDLQTQSLLVFASSTRNPRRNHLIVLLSLKAGLRAGEIAKLTWDMVLGPTGEIGLVIELRDCAAKKKSGRLIPIHPSPRTALAAWRKMTTATGPIIRSERGGPMTPVSMVNWFAIAYRAVGLEGCSSHSGRRTFITRAARLAGVILSVLAVRYRNGNRSSSDMKPAFMASLVAGSGPRPSTKARSSMRRP
jgi:integrase